MDSQTFKDMLSKYLTRDNLTLALAIFGSAGTFISGFTSYLRSRKSFQIKIERICKFGNSIVAYITILNKSHFPISISDISLKFDKNLYPGCHIPLRHITTSVTKDGNCISSHDCVSMPFPVNIGGLSGSSGYLIFDIPEALQENLKTPLTFQVSSNRGRPIQMQLTFSEWAKWSHML